MWTNLIDRTLKTFIRTGTLEVTYPDGQVRRYGTGEAPTASMQLNDPTLPRRMVQSPDMAIGEGYMEGGLTVGDDDLHGLLGLLVMNRTVFYSSPLLQLDVWRRWLTRRAIQYNPLGRAQKHVAHHYDISEELYDLFLDDDRQYSCAYFRDPQNSLEQAQADKKALIAQKLCLSPGQRVLDIGCGWGGLAITLARDFDVHVTGVTLSENQHRIANERVKAAGLEDKIEILLLDYREVKGTFDRIVSVGMFEHVGLPHYREYFDKVNEALEPDGVALIHTIGFSGPPTVNSPWIAKYIFPGGYVPSMSEVLPRVEKIGLTVTDIEVWRLHYSMTLRHWHDRFMAHSNEVLTLFDEKFLRMWRYYLVACEVTFRYGLLVVFQFQLAKKNDAVPLTREYLMPRAADPTPLDVVQRAG